MQKLQLTKIPKGWKRLRTGSTLKGLTKLFYRRDTSWEDGVDSFYAYGHAKVTKDDTANGYVWFQKVGSA